MKPAALVVTKLSPADHNYPRVLARELRAMGWTVNMLPVEAVRGRYEDLCGAIERKRRELDVRAVFSINFTHTLSRVSGDLGIKYVSWGEVFPLRFSPPRIPAGADVWCFDASKLMAERFTAAGAQGRFLPLGYDEHAFAPGPRTAAIPLSFVGNGLPHMERNLDELVAAIARQPDEGSAARRLVHRAVETFFAGLKAMPWAAFEAAGSDLEARARAHVASFGMPEPLERIVLEMIVPRLDIAAGYLSRVQRVASLSALAAVGELAVFGAGWEGTAASAHARESIRFDDAPAVYSSSAVNVNIQRFYHRGINDRLFNVPACGGFLLTHRVEGIEEFFEPEREIVTYGSVEELADKARHYLAHEAERERIAEAGARRVRDFRLCAQLVRLLQTCDLPAERAAA